MKKVLLAAIICCICGNISAQEKVAYKPLAEFGADTFAYLKYNFSKDARYNFAGKTVEDVFNIIEVALPTLYVQTDWDRNIDEFQFFIQPIEYAYNYSIEEDRLIGIRVILPERIDSENHPEIRERFIARGIPFCPLTALNYNLIKRLRIERT